MSVSLVCVDPAQVHLFWPHVRAMAFSAIQATGLSTCADLERSVLDGRSLLWLAWNGSQIEAIATTELAMLDNKVCILTACAGTRRGRWIDLLKQIEEYARKEGCTAMRIFGRKGWARVLPDYKQTAIVIEKAL